MDKAIGCIFSLVFLGVLGFLLYSLSYSSGRNNGYRMGLCHGRGGEWAEIRGEMKCIVKPTPINPEAPR